MPSEYDDLTHRLTIADDYLHQWKSRAEEAEDQLGEWQKWQEANEHLLSQQCRTGVEEEENLATGSTAVFGIDSNPPEGDDGEAISEDGLLRTIRSTLGTESPAFVRLPSVVAGGGRRLLPPNLGRPLPQRTDGTQPSSAAPVEPRVVRAAFNSITITGKQGSRRSISIRGTKTNRFYYPGQPPHYSSAVPER